MILFTSLNLLQRVLAVNSRNSRAMAVLFNSIAAFMALLIFIAAGSYKNFALPSAPKAWLGLLVASLCYATFERNRFTVAKLLDASVMATVQNISLLVAFTGGLFFYSESLAISKLLGGALIIGALFLVSVDDSPRKSSRKGIVLAVLISIMLGLGWILDKLGAQFFGPPSYNIFAWSLPIVFIYLPGVKFRAIETELRIASWRVFLLAGLNVTGYLMQLEALKMAEATKVIPIVQTSIIFTVLLGIVLLKEREHALRKIVAALMAILGVYFLI